MGTLAGSEADVAEAERAVVLVLCDGLATE